MLVTAIIEFAFSTHRDTYLGRSSASTKKISQAKGDICHLVNAIFMLFGELAVLSGYSLIANIANVFSREKNI